MKHLCVHVCAFMCVSAYYTTTESQGAHDKWKHNSAGLRKNKTKQVSKTQQ